jgi:hypothetical protein
MGRARRGRIVMTALLPGPSRRALEADHDVVAPTCGAMPRATLER